MSEDTPTAEGDPTSTQSDEPAAGGGIVLDIAEQRIKPEIEQPSARGWLRAGAGTFGVVLLAAGAYGIWRGGDTGSR